jgi:hypothetical protein
MSYCQMLCDAFDPECPSCQLTKTREERDAWAGTARQFERERDEARAVARDNYRRRKIAHVALWGERSDVFGFRDLEELYPWLREDAS